jgi:phosphatidylethanolamine/phosphatidyl-N-methylethanolamine N-methyltransferase
MQKAELGRLEADQVRRAYRRWAPVYDYVFGPLTVAGRRQAVRHINRGRGRVLEVGVGTGIALSGYAEHLRIIGIDLSKEMLDQARRKVVREGLDHVEDIREMDAASLAFEDASFDTVIAMYVLTTVPDPGQVMAELERVCRPGGEVILVNHFSAESGPRAVIERRLARHAPALGWRPEFPISIALSRPRLELIEERRLAPFGIFTMLRLRRLQDGPAAAGNA